jgi:cytochrome c-type biogenesis protein CcsB
MDLTAVSVFALWTAAVLYAIAMVAYSVRLAKVADAKVEARREAAVAVGANKGGGSSAAPAPARPFDATADAEVVAAKALGIGRAATVVGAGLHGVGVLARGLDSGHVPWSNMYEFTISGSFVAVVVFLVVQRFRDVTFLAPGVTGLAAIALGLGLTVLYSESTGLQPALQSFWLVIHVSIAVIATGVLTVAAVASVLQLARDGRESGTGIFAGRRSRWLEAVPSSANLEALAFRLNAVGFVLWTFTLVAGAIWAEHAWGRYWGWDPKEIWTFVIWVLYAAYLHARTTQGWSGRKAAWLSLAAYTAVIMNFTVVNIVFQGLHSYAGVS